MIKDKRVFVIYNPKAGKGKIKAAVPYIRKMYTKAGLKNSFIATKGKDDAYELTGKIIKKYFDKDRLLYIVAAGGDGTLNEVMRGVIDSGHNVPIGIIPTGSTNDFGYSLNLTGSPVDLAKKALDAILKDSGFSCDAARFNGKSFVYTSAFGLFSDVSYATPQKIKNIFGHFAYIMYGALNLPKTRRIHAEVSYESVGPENNVQYIDEDFLLGMVVSAKSVGGFRGITGSEVELDDGMHELLFVRWPKNPVMLFKTLRHALMILRKNPEALKEAKDISVEYGIKILKVKKVCFRFDKPVSWAIDGEDGGKQKEADISVERKAVTYLVG